MIYQIHTGEVINVETLEDIRGWMNDDTYEIATDLIDEKVHEVRVLENELADLRSENRELEKTLERIVKLCEKYVKDVETKELTKRQLLTRFLKILDTAESEE
ncbi:hypothetical protein [Enterococcus italicus]|uniref:hypothetical protein n=1 Tax=Enterococcus italicus TaxID=246144 RepID=UPI002073CD02|nr:hypothetical protein [Enterococcus italicus]